MILISGYSAEPVLLQEREDTSKQVPVPRERDTGEKPGNSGESQSQTEGESLPSGIRLPSSLGEKFGKVSSLGKFPVWESTGSKMGQGEGGMVGRKKEKKKSTVNCKCPGGPGVT